MESFPTRLDNLIREMRLTPTQFGRLTEINRTSLSNFLTGRTKPSLDTLERICAADFRISAEYLIRGDGTPLYSAQMPNPVVDREIRLCAEITALEEELREEKLLVKRLQEQLLNFTDRLLSSFSPLK